jgi:hypothetical protein
MSKQERPNPEGSSGSNVVDLEEYRATTCVRQNIEAIARATAPSTIEKFEREDKERELFLLFADMEDTEESNN